MSKAVHFIKLAIHVYYNAAPERNYPWCDIRWYFISGKQKSV